MRCPRPMWWLAHAIGHRPLSVIGCSAAVAIALSSLLAAAIARGDVHVRLDPRDLVEVSRDSIGNRKAAFASARERFTSPLSPAWLAAHASHGHDEATTPDSLTHFDEVVPLVLFYVFSDISRARSNSPAAASRAQGLARRGACGAGGSGGREHGLRRHPRSRARPPTCSARGRMRRRPGAGGRGLASRAHRRGQG